MIVLVGETGHSQTIPTKKGGSIVSLGLPPVYKGYVGGELQWFRPGDSSSPAILGIGGVRRDIGSPVLGMAAIGIEGYGGVRKEDFDGGVRAEFAIPALGLGTGVDYNVPDDEFNFMLRLNLSVKRAGILGRGSILSLRWIPKRGQTIGVGVTVPLWGSNVGKTRPARDNILLREAPQAERLVIANPEQKLAETVADIRKRSLWIARLSQPLVDRSGKAREVMEADLSELQAHIDSVDPRFPEGHTLNEEIRVYHQSLEYAFRLASAPDSLTEKEAALLGRLISSKAREYLLDEVILPYNNLLGQRKEKDNLSGLSAVARTEFARWLLSESNIELELARKAYWVYQSICDIMEENRAELNKRWRDSRFVWLPLQFALKLEQYDTQTEVNDIVERATRRSFSADNQVWYVINEQFQWEMARSVRRAKDYHVLWIHDFACVNNLGDPDRLAYLHTINYLEAMAEQVEAYDETGTLPTYFIFLDQHYFELNKSRRWLRILSKPLTETVELPSEYEEWCVQLRQAQERLQQAVDSSVLLSLEKSQYGQRWLRQRIRVHVNITNPADPSFFSYHMMGLLPVLDNNMRDHRKIAFYDITEADPYRGMALFTGMGIGENYVGTSWEDRAIMLKGPAALAVKDAGRSLLLAHGMKDEEMPIPLRQMPLAADYESRIKADHDERTPAWIPSWGGVMQLHNGTGFQQKPANVANAILYSLMPEGSVLTVPSSLWQSYIYASLLAGSALRGCRVLVICPTSKSAPSSGALTLARAHGLMSRLVAFSNIMKPYMESEDGLLKVGLYSPEQGVGDLAGRVKHIADPQSPWMDRLWPLSKEALDVATNISEMLDSIGYSARYLKSDTDAIEPKLHLKANFAASSTAWEKLCTSPDLATVLKGYVAYLALQNTGGKTDEEQPNVRDVPEKLRAEWHLLVKRILESTPLQEREQMIFYLTVGSVNLDYRSMVLDGEVMLMMSGWLSTIGFFDFLILKGLCDWIDTIDELEQDLRPPGTLQRKVAGFMKLLL